jgi:histidine triad (HIT) family protein
MVMNPEQDKTDCVFCKIAAGKIPAKIIYRDDEVFAFPDIHPLTPVHILVVSVKHIPSLAVMPDKDTPLVGKMVRAANQIAREQGITESGYRLTINSGPDAGQLVPHLHIHLMGGRHLDWKH